MGHEVNCPKCGSSQVKISTSIAAQIAAIIVGAIILGFAIWYVIVLDAHAGVALVAGVMAGVLLLWGATTIWSRSCTKCEDCGYRWLERNNVIRDQA